MKDHECVVRATEIAVEDYGKDIDDLPDNIQSKITEEAVIEQQRSNHD